MYAFMGDTVTMNTVLMVKQPTYEALTARIEALEKELQQRIQCESDLRDLERQYKLIFDKARDAIFIIQNEVIQFANRRARMVLGYSDEELSTTAIAELIHPKDREQVVARHRKKQRTRCGISIPGGCGICLQDRPRLRTLSASRY